jgi:hypothetical protein
VPAGRETSRYPTNAADRQCGLCTAPDAGTTTNARGGRAARHGDVTRDARRNRAHRPASSKGCARKKTANPWLAAAENCGRGARPRAADANHNEARWMAETSPYHFTKSTNCFRDRSMCQQMEGKRTNPLRDAMHGCGASSGY